jgi:hypothetical protein
MSKGKGSASNEGAASRTDQGNMPLLAAEGTTEEFNFEDNSDTEKSKKQKSSKTADSSPVFNVNGYDGVTSSLLTFDNKCDAAAAGAEFKTSSYVSIFYQYELLTTTSRDVLPLVDIIDKNVQHFLATWLVDCDTTAQELKSGLDGYYNRKRRMQLTLAPIVGTGVDTWDTVLFNGDPLVTSCQSLVASPLLGQACYKVIGTVRIYLDETMQVTPADVRALALQTLAVGMNYAGTDFSMLDPDILGLTLIQGYDEAPETVLEENWAANQRSWDQNAKNPYAKKGGGRSAGAKFGIVFATLLCVVFVVLIGVYMYKNREKLLGDQDWDELCCCGRTPADEKKLQQSNNTFDVDDESYLENKVHPKRMQVVPDDAASHRGFDVTVRTYPSSSSPRSTGTMPLSPDPETPMNKSDSPSFLEESNIVTPKSAASDYGGRSTISDVSSGYGSRSVTSTPDDRIKMSLSKDVIRGSHTKPSRLMSNHRSYECDDTVDL